MPWDGTWDTERPKSEKNAIINNLFWEKFQGYKELTIQPFARDQEETYSYAEAVIRARELLDQGRSFTVWLTSNSRTRLTVELKPEGGTGVLAAVLPKSPPPNEAYDVRKSLDPTQEVYDIRPKY